MFEFSLWACECVPFQHSTPAAQTLKSCLFSSSLLQEAPIGKTKCRQLRRNLLYGQTNRVDASNPESRTRHPFRVWEVGFVHERC